MAISGEGITDMTEPGASLATGGRKLEPDLARLIVRALALEVEPESVAPEAPLFGAGLGLDSIDALELALAISTVYGVQLRSDDERNHQIFASLRSLADHVDRNRLR